MLENSDKLIDNLVDFLQSIQRNDGGFDTMYQQPYFNAKSAWMYYSDNVPFSVATVLLPLFFVNSEKAKTITDAGADFLLKHSFGKKLWKFGNLSEKYNVPFDSDSTSLCSYVLQFKKTDIKNKKLLNQLINGKDNYNLWILSDHYYSDLTFVENFRLFIHNIKAQNSIPIRSKAINCNDYEFSVSCNNLLYIGKEISNQHVWHEVKKALLTNTLKYLYYPNIFHAFYLYARLTGYGNHNDLIPEKKILNKFTSEMYGMLNDKDFTLNYVLFANALLFLNCEIQQHSKLFDKCFSQIDTGFYKNSAAYFSSNIRTDLQPSSKQPNTYFGSPGITCSLYIEFLNLYYKKSVTAN